MSEEKAQYNSHKNSYKRNNIYFFIISNINLLLLISLIISTKSQTESEGSSSFILLKFNYIGLVQYIGTSFEKLPTHLYINDIEQDDTTKNSKIINITNITEEVKLEWINTKIETCRHMFSSLPYISEIDMTEFDSSSVTDMAYMFYNCQSLYVLNLRGLNTSLVTTMEYMFAEDKVLRPIDLSSFDTSRVLVMNSMFYNCLGMTRLDVSSFNTSLVYSMERMFQQVSYLEVLNLSNFNTRRVGSMNYMFSYGRSLKTLILTSFETPSLGQMSYFLENCGSLVSIDLSSFDTTSVVKMISTFQGCSSLERLDLSNFRTPNVNNMDSLFNGCLKLSSLNIDNFITNKVTQTNVMFQHCSSLTFLNLSHFDTSNVLTMANMFANCVSLTSVILSSFDTSKVDNMAFLFENCNSLTSLDILNFDTSNVLNMNGMFFGCNSLTSINIPNFVTTKVNNMISMFQQCTELTSLNLYSFHPINNNNYEKMFYGCSKLEYVNFYNYVETDLTNFNDIITQAHDDIKLCIHVNKEARIYTTYTEHLLEECLIPDIIPTENIIMLETTNEPLKTTEKIITPDTTIQNEPLKTTEKIITSDSTIQNLSGQQSTNQESISESSSMIHNNPPVDTNAVSQYNSQTQYSSNILSTNNDDDDKNHISSTSPSEKIESHVNTQTFNLKSFTNNEIAQMNTFAPEYIILDDIIIFQGYNNTQIYNSITYYMLHDFSKNENHQIYIKGDNDFIFEITTIENEIDILDKKNHNTPNTSIIDFRECNNLLKQKYFPGQENVSLIILKFEKTTNITSEKNIQFEIYEPFNHTKLDISICQNKPIDIYIPTQLEEKTQKIIANLEKLGYDVFNLNSPFYTDFCTKYTTEDGTDMTLADRKKYIYEAIKNEVNCQENCEFSSYDSQNRYLECSCKVENDIDTVDYKKFSLKKMYETFYDVLKYSNYKVIFCYKLVFTLDNFSYNKGCWIIFILFILYLTQLAIYLNKKISPFKLNIARYHFRIASQEINKDNIYERNSSHKEAELNQEKNGINSNIQFPPLKKYKNKKYSKYEAKNSDTNLLNTKTKEKLKENENDIKISTKKLDIIDFEENKKMDKTTLHQKELILENFELNNLEFEEALIMDKRNFFQIYWSILKREHSLIFTFFFHNDYNLYYVKFAKFIFLLATDMAMNVFFFSDETMNKLYLSYGKYDFVQQIPQIIYSKIVSNIIEVFLCYLSLTDKHYYEIKALSKNEKIKIFDIIKCTRKKIIIFFVLTFLIFLFYWYLVTAFCAVYENTQIVYIKDSLLSFVTGIFIPLIIYLFPSLFRFISLRCKCCDCKFMYSLSGIIPLF